MSNPYAGDMTETVDMRELSDEEVEKNRKTNRKIAAEIKAMKEAALKAEGKTSGPVKANIATLGQLLSKARFNPKRPVSAEG